jgi:PAS domain-containing protein
MESTATSYDQGDAIPTTKMTPEQVAERDRLEAALQRAGRRAADALQARAAAIAEIGELLRRDRAAGDLVGIVAAQHLTGLTRPTLTAARRDTAAWQEIRELARVAAGVGDDEGDHETQLHARYPHLATLDSAAAWLLQQWTQEHPHDPWGPLDQAPWGVQQLAAAYRDGVRKLAEGEPA